jgi:ubiquinone/menaquinone biosynthesis C-methylase UbiE
VSAEREAIVEAFDARAAGYRESDWHRRSAERLVDLCRLTPGDAVLDAGTGTGFAALAAARLVAPAGRVVGVDVSPRMLDAAQAAAADSALTNLELVLADATSLQEMPASSFDVVTSATSLLYMNAVAALREWHRLLKPGGLLALSTMRAGFPLGGRLFREAVAAVGIQLKDPCEPLGSPDACRHLLGACGFTLATFVEEPVDFTDRDVARAWESNLLAPAHQEVRALPPPQLDALRRRYLDALAAADPGALTSSPMLYVLAHR